MTMTWLYPPSVLRVEIYRESFLKTFYDDDCGIVVEGGMHFHRRDAETWRIFNWNATNNVAPLW